MPGQNWLVARMQLTCQSERRVLQCRERERGSGADQIILAFWIAASRIQFASGGTVRRIDVAIVVAGDTRRRGVGMHLTLILVCRELVSRVGILIAPRHSLRLPGLRTIIITQASIITAMRIQGDVRRTGSLLCGYVLDYAFL